MLLICFALMTANLFAQQTHASETTTYYFIRHAEKDRSDASEKDPHLTVQGHQRAKKWRDILQHIDFDLVYATDYNRTKETAQPTADKNQIEISLYSVNDSYNKEFKTATKGKIVLVVGHSNTIPDFVNAVLGHKKYEDIDDANNGNLYIVTLADENVSDIVLTIN